jgi:hypothetical protein
MSVLSERGIFFASRAQETNREAVGFCSSPIKVPRKWVSKGGFPPLVGVKGAKPLGGC